jgi:hypothetical protein
VVQPFAFEKFTTGTVTDRKAMLLAAALVGLGLSAILTGRLALVGFSILDDHHLIGWLGPKHHLPLEKFWSTLIFHRDWAVRHRCSVPAGLLFHSDLRGLALG